MRTFRRFLIGFLLVVPVSAGATTLLRQEVATLARDADLVVEGKVKRVQSRWSDDRRRIVTDVEVEVAETIKGAGPTTVTITQPGGVVGEFGQRVSGLASFEAAEEVILFLNKRGKDRFQVAGMAQGKFKIERSPDGKADRAVPESVGDAQLLDPANQQPVKQSLKALDLKELKRRIRAESALPREERPTLRKPTP